MGKQLIRQVDVITMDNANSVLRAAEVAIDGGMIAGVGEVPPDFVPDEIIDAPGFTVAPGLFNAHTHTASVLLRAQATAWPPYWLEDRRRIVELGLSADDVYWAAALAAAEMIRNGIVGFADQFFHMHRVAELVVESGMRASLGWITFGAQEGEVGTDLPGVASFVRQWQGAGNGRINTVLAPYSPAACTPQFLARTAAVAARLGSSIHVHAAETREQVQASLALYDLTPVEVLNRNGIFEVPAVMAHGVHLSEPDVAILAAKNITVVSCPTAQSRRGMGWTPISRLQAAGVNVALGSDGNTGSHSLNAIQEARHAALLNDAGSPPEGQDAPRFLRMIGQNAALALGFPQSGQIAPGYNADLIMFKHRTTRLWLMDDIQSALLYATEGADISDVMVAGRWLMRKRELSTLDEERILFETARRSRR